MLRMDQVYVVRHKVLVEGVPERQVARELGIARNTVRRYVSSEVEVGKRASVRRKTPVRERVWPSAEKILQESPRWLGGKQRLTAARLHALLVEAGHKIGLRTVQAWFKEWKRTRKEVFVPLVYRPGELAEVDFFEVLVDI